MKWLMLTWQAARITGWRVAHQGMRITGLWLYEKIWRLINGVSPAATSCVREVLYVGGQQYQRGLPHMNHWGIGATLSLREEADDSARGVAMTNHLWLPIPDNDAPSIEQLSRGVAFIQQQLREQRAVYVHCGQGVGRAPTMAAAFMMSEGLSVRSALNEIRAVRPFITPTPVQLRRLEEWADHLRNSDGG